MSALTFTVKKPPEYTLDVSQLTPDYLAGKTIARIKKIRLRYGNQKIAAGDLFTISGTDTDNIVINRSTEKLIGIGHEMGRGTIEVKGNAGNFIGQKMRGGSIIIRGNAGTWAASSMSNGYIEINGNAGDYLGAGLPGDPHGMSNGHVFVTGDAGDRVGDRMRRGIIIIRGRAGDYCGSRMVAGTVIVLDKAGKYAGFGMKRGTIVLAKKPKNISASFKSCGNLKIQFLRLLFKQLSEMGKHYAFFRKFGPEAHRFAGDLASKGKGELLILQTIKTGG